MNLTALFLQTRTQNLLDKSTLLLGLNFNVPGELKEPLCALSPKHVLIHLTVVTLRLPVLLWSFDVCSSHSPGEWCSLAILIRTLLTSSESLLQSNNQQMDKGRRSWGRSQTRLFFSPQIWVCIRVDSTFIFSYSSPLFLFSLFYDVFSWNISLSKHKSLLDMTTI